MRHDMAEGRPGHDGPRNAHSLGTSIPDPADIAAVLALSDERDRWERYALDLARAGYAAGYERGDHHGYARGDRLMQREWPAVVRPFIPGPGEPTPAEISERRWGPGGRERFADPRPGDQTPEQMVARARASWAPLGLTPPGMMHIGGPAVHNHPYPRRCNAACHAYEPGCYPIADVIAILRTLPGDYAQTIAELERKAAATKEAA